MFDCMGVLQHSQIGCLKWRHAVLCEHRERARACPRRSASELVRQEVQDLDQHEILSSRSRHALHQVCLSIAYKNVLRSDRHTVDLWGAANPAKRVPDRTYGAFVWVSRMVGFWHENKKKTFARREKPGSLAWSAPSPTLALRAVSASCPTQPSSSGVRHHFESTWVLLFASSRKLARRLTRTLRSNTTSLSIESARDLSDMCFLQECAEREGVFRASFHRNH